MPEWGDAVGQTADEKRDGEVPEVTEAEVTVKLSNGETRRYTVQGGWCRWQITDGVNNSISRAVFVFEMPRAITEHAPVDGRAKVTYPFNPTWTLAPAETLREWLDDHGVNTPRVIAGVVWPLPDGKPHRPGEAHLITVDERVAAAMNAVLDRAELTAEYARLLEEVTGISERMWAGLEKQYRNALAAGLVDMTDV